VSVAPTFATFAQKICNRPLGAAIAKTKFFPLFHFILANNQYQIFSGLFIYSTFSFRNVCNEYSLIINLLYQQPAVSYSDMCISYIQR
jgi:hypothetical protein